MADTRRDIIHRIKILGEDCTNQIQALHRLYTANPATGGTPQKAAVDQVNANIAAMTAAMAAYAAATP